MQQLVDVRELRRRTTDYVARASGGDPVLVMRSSRVVAVLRPANSGEVIPRYSVRDLHRHAGRILRAVENGPLVIGWYGRRAAVLAPVPPDFPLANESTEESQ